MIELDVRGLSCPIPVVKTKQAMDKNPGEPIAVSGETAVSRENISRLATMRKYSIKEDLISNDKYRIILTPAGQ
jgi:tRNA 2-thiouridine synthesizing protein A